MTEVKGLPVAGYKATQSQEKIDQVSEFKRDEERLLRKLDAMDAENAVAQLQNGGRPLPVGQMPYDPRWIAIGRTHLQEAFMFINRSVFQPGRVDLPDDEPTALELGRAARGKDWTPGSGSDRDEDAGR